MADDCTASSACSGQQHRYVSLLDGLNNIGVGAAGGSRCAASVGASVRAYDSCTVLHRQCFESFLLHMLSFINSKPALQAGCCRCVKCGTQHTVHCALAFTPYTNVTALQATPRAQDSNAMIHAHADDRCSCRTAQRLRHRQAA